MQVLVLGCSLNPHSFSQVLAREMVDELRGYDGVETQLIDLREQALPFCDGGNDADAGEAIKRAVGEADAIIVCAPIYNFDVSAATKNVVELTGQAWRGKVVGIACAAGGAVSFMSAMGLANSLMLDFQCLIVPRFLYTTGQDFQHQHLTGERARQRLEGLVAEIVRIGTALTRDEKTPSGEA